jgi:hypothetical protein
VAPGRAPGIEGTESAGFPLAVTCRTPEGTITGVFEQLAAQWGEWTAHDAYVVGGERVVVLARYTATNKATGKPMTARVAHSFIV